MKDLGVYVHIPFCKAKCSYCDFVSFAGKEELMESYVEALLQEIENADLSKYKIKTVYIGGGTPSILESTYIGKILEKISIDNRNRIYNRSKPRNRDKRKIRELY